MLVTGVNRWWQERQALFADRRVRRLEKQSKHPKGSGWFFDPKDHNLLYLLGYSLQLDRPWTPGYSLEYLEDQYRLLKQQLAVQYPDFSPRNTLIEVEVSYAAALLQDRQLLANVQPVVHHYTDLYTGQPCGSEVHHLDTLLELDGDQVKLRIAPGSYYQGYGFFVYGHPGSIRTEGLWCRPIPDPLAIVANEPTM